MWITDQYLAEWVNALLLPLSTSSSVSLLCHSSTDSMILWSFSMASGNMVLPEVNCTFYLLPLLWGNFYPDFCSPNCFRTEFVTLSAQLTFENNLRWKLQHTSFWSNSFYIDCFCFAQSFIRLLQFSLDELSWQHTFWNLYKALNCAFFPAMKYVFISCMHRGEPPDWCQY